MRKENFFFSYPKMLSERLVLGTLLLVTSLLPAISYSKWHNPLPGFVLALLLQFAGMVSYIKWIRKNKPGTVATVADLAAIVMISIVAGALVLGGTMYQHEKSTAKLVTGVVLGGVMALISMSISINAADKLVKDK